MSNSSSVLGKNVLELFPSLDRLDFSRDCEIYGRWLGSVLAPDPWMPNETALGTTWLSINLLYSALPDNFTTTPEGAWLQGQPLSVLSGKLADWMAAQMFSNQT